MVTKVRGKFFVLGIRKTGRGAPGSQIELGAVSASENEKSENTIYHRYTPQGKVEIFIDNPAAEEFFTIGKNVYVDFSEAPAE